ncbi:DUF948 domain-containing protein [Cytobacillus spongiae]|jgi:uncharacterized protein YoxC|uniref:DUF948 domain-containing protein n=1 Tax=Cytobacillus spongiae TaxID=2901381 RepID=UPI001F343E3E|nr:DUF948 domain-containing protein [Cytobacillus spongiae]UII55213.1 DUF948 domain-containing protein [Cytobacillus spongiae]
MKIILYLSVALIAIAFFILVIYVSKTLKSLQGTLDRVSHTLAGLERQLDGVTRETTELLSKTNTLADDIQKKSESLNSVVDAVKEVGDSVRGFNQSITKIRSTMNKQLDANEEKISQVVQWSNVFLELKDKWKLKRQQSNSSDTRKDVSRERARARQ